MPAQYSWVSALRIPSNKIDEWKMSAPNNLPFTFWCLQSHRLNEAQYFAWAKDHYELPTLDASFFDQPADLTLWESIRSVANWSSAMIPLEIWDGVVFIGCVEPVVDAHWSFPVAYVLTDAASLSRRWSEYNLPPTSQKIDEDVVELSDQPIFQTRIDAHGLLAGLSVPDLPPRAEEAEAEPIVAPEGLSFELKLNVPTSDNTHDEPAGFQTVVSTPPKLSFDVGAPVPTVKPSFEPPPVDEDKTKAISRPVITPIAHAEVPPPAPLVLEAMDLTHAPERVEDARTFDQTLAWSLAQLRSKFQSAIILSNSKNGLIPWKWTPGLRPQGTPGALTFGEPSLFRIASRTLRAYHGFVVENPVHKKFFADWGMTSVPPHVTAVPIANDGMLEGLFLCISSEKDVALEALEFAEKTVDRTMRRLEDLGQPFKKAS